MRILLIGSTPPPFHGSSIYLRDLINAIKTDNEWEVHHINTSDGRYDLDNMGILDIQNVTTALLAICRAFFKCIKQRPNIIYVPIAQNTLGFLRDGIFILIGRIFRIKTVIHLHGSFFNVFYNRSNFIMRYFIDIVIKGCNGAIVLGDKLKEIFVNWIKIEDIYVLPNFISPNSIEKLEKCRLNEKRNHNDFTISYLSNIIEGKGIFDFLESIKILTGKKNNIAVNIAGRVGLDPNTGLTAEETEERLNKRIKELGCIKYYGPIVNEEEKWNFLLSTSVLVFPSWQSEGQPLVILEAMATGVPIISTKDCGVIDETVIDGETGILVEKRNPMQIANAIEKLMNNYLLRKRISENAILLFKEKYTINNHLNKFKSICNSILNDKKIIKKEI